MAVFRNLVVGVKMPETRPWDAANLDPACRLAIRQAFDLAEPIRATVHLVCVLPKPTSHPFTSDESAPVVPSPEEIEADGVLADVVQRYTRRAQQPPPTTCTVAFGGEWQEILRLALPQPQVLIVCGTQAQSAVSQVLFGSTGQKLLRNASCPVWLVKPRLDEDAVMDILATTDLNSTGELVLEISVALGQALAARVNVLHVVDAGVYSAAPDLSESESTLVARRQQRLAGAEQELHEQLSRTDYRTVRSGVQTHLLEGATDECILSALNDMKIDLLVMGTAARGGVAGMLLGNTAERLLPAIPCAVLVIKPRDFVSPTELT